jgi:hypothetical protein
MDLQKVAGNKMRTILGKLTNNPFMGVVVGTLTTAAIQSSSATTVMVVGFVTATSDDAYSSNRSHLWSKYWHNSHRTVDSL